MPPQKSGRSTDDLQRKNERIIREAIEVGLRAAIPAPAAAPPISKTPAFDDRTAPPRKTIGMSDSHGSGVYYPALKADVENLKGQYHELKSDLEAKFTGLSSEIRSLGESFTSRFDKFAERQSGNQPDLFKLAGVAAVLLTVVGAFGTLAKANLDTNIAFTNEKITSGDKVLTDQMMRLVGVVDHLSENTMPRSEIDAKVNQGVREREDLRNVKADKSSLSEMDRRIGEQNGALKEQIARLQDEADDIRDKQVSRAELEQHWREAQDRLNINAERILGLQKELNGGTVSDRLKTLQDQLESLRQKFILPSTSH